MRMKNINRASHLVTRIFAAIATSLVIAVATPGWAKEAGKEAHPRSAEVTHRDRHLASQMNKKYGDLSGHYNQLQKQDAAIRQQTHADMQKNGGHLTKAEQKQINGEENNLHKEISADQGRPPKTQFEQDHPRRAEVLHRDNRINGTLNADAGKLGGNYGSLKQQQESIHQQEQTDARANGGYITKAQQGQLNTEEDQLKQEIRTDHK
jgi:hypothetical protein